MPIRLYVFVGVTDNKTPKLYMMADKPQKTVADFLENAKQIEFLTAEQHNDIPAVFIIFEDFLMACAFYPEVIRVNKEKEQYFEFIKRDNQLILSIILKDEGRSHAKMKVDYDDGEFEEFIQNVSSTTPYLVLFGQYGEDGTKRIAGPLSEDDGFLMFRQYKY
jgi:hypothetical protein